MPSFPAADPVLKRDRVTNPSGMSSLNRLTETDGNKHIDYQIAFAPHRLGHSHAAVSQSLRRMLDQGCSLFGSGKTGLEGRLAKRICGHLQWLVLPRLSR